MANINKIKVGTVDPDAIMFDTYSLPVYKNIPTFGSIVPKDNTTNQPDFNQVNHSKWQINDGWEVEIISPNRIAIKKFKIDTWGLRLVTSDVVNLVTNRLKVRVEGLTYVHENVICHTVGSDVPDGFTDAYCGTGGYNVYWYPGQFTSGKSAKGLCIQQGIGYLSSTKEVDDSLQMGKHPWDINTSIVLDGVLEGNWSDGSYKAVTIGLFGGTQNASEWHDESTGAYRQYDISDHPIYINLDGIGDDTVTVDVSTQECWDAYVGDTQVWHKNKTFENFWKKYGLAFPTSWNIYRTKFSTSDYITWVSPTRFRVNYIPSEGITIRTTTTTTANYVNIDWKQFTAKLSDGVPDGATVKIVREFSNAYDTYDEGTHTWSDPTQNIEIVLEVGDNIVPAVNKEIHKKDTDPSMTYNECAIVITPGLARDITDFYIELISTFNSSGNIAVTEGEWGLSSMYVHPIVDLESYIDRMNFMITPANADFWNPIKEYYKTHVFNNNSGSKFRNAGNIGEIELTLPDANYQTYDNAFKFSQITKLTLKGQPKTQITSLNGIFEGCGSLKTLEIEIDPEHTPDCIAGANDCSNMFNSCGLETYPAKFINWAENHTNTQTYSVPASHLMSAFWWCAIKNIPAYPTEDPEDPRNVMYAGAASGMFNRDSNLETVGPILNLELIKPSVADNIFVDCTKLNYIRIKHLNHGDWHFDNTEFTSGKKHGTLAALGAESVQYLFNNLMDLNTYDPEKSQNTPSNSFTEWSSSYFNSGVYQSAYDFKFNGMGEIVGHLRTSSQASAPFIVHTAKTGINMSFNVSGLAEGDSLVFTAAGDVGPDLTITGDGQYTVTKNDTVDKGFKLIGNNSIETDIKITINKGWDLRIPTVDHANLYCPEEWSDKVTSEMVTAANAKGWTIYIGGTLKTV